MTKSMPHTLTCGPGAATLRSPSGEVLRCFVWRMDGGHVEEIVGEGDRARRTSVLTGHGGATLGYVKDHQQAAADLLRYVCPAGTVLA